MTARQAMSGALFARLGGGGVYHPYVNTVTLHHSVRLHTLYGTWMLMTHSRSNVQAFLIVTTVSYVMILVSIYKYIITFKHLPLFFKTSYWEIRTIFTKFKLKLTE